MIHVWNVTCPHTHVVLPVHVTGSHTDRLEQLLVAHVTPVGGHSLLTLLLAEEYGTKLAIVVVLHSWSHYR